MPPKIYKAYDSRVIALFLLLVLMQTTKRITNQVEHTKCSAIQGLQIATRTEQGDPCLVPLNTQHRLLPIIS